VEAINLVEKFATFDDAWSPKVVGSVNDFDVKLAKLRGAFVWHTHDEEDELFFVVKGRLAIKLRDGEVTLEPGEMVVVPHGVEHMPVADDEAQVLLFERRGTINTGDVRGERTVLEPQRI
jgi:mannose-6-phosphate isomerase-like protein (cupin superfamily)